ncbi:hypothetical protein D3C78_1246720 [compost metagenome]
MGGAADGVDEHPLVRLPIQPVDEAAVDLQVGQGEMGQVADQAEASAEMLQAELVAGFADRLAERQQLLRGRQAALVQLQGEQVGSLGVLAQGVENQGHADLVVQGGAGQA